MSLSRVTITAPGGGATAEFVPDANLLCASLRHGGQELLGGHGVPAYAERGKTMGIPLLYPWANRLSRPGFTAAGTVVELGAPEGRYPVDPNGLPIHGALPGALRWEIAELHGDGDRLRATLAWDSPDLLALFPFRHHAEVEAVLGEHALTLRTSVHADGGDPVPISFGYHPYLVLPGSSRTGWQVELGAGERLELDAQMIPTGDRTPLEPRALRLGETSFDDGLAGLSGPGGGRFSVSDGERAIAVSFETGYAWAQVYAPPGHDFICFEPMTAPTDALNSGTGLTVIAPGESYRAGVSFAFTP